MIWKDELALWVKQNKRRINDLEVWRQQQIVYPSVRFKTVDSRGKVVVIQLSEKGQWMKPTEWADNHVASLRERMYNEMDRMCNLLGPLKVIQEVCAKLAPQVETKGPQPSQWEIDFVDQGGSGVVISRYLTDRDSSESTDLDEIVKPSLASIVNGVQQPKASIRDQLAYHQDKVTR